MYQELATANIEDLKAARPKKILTSCPHCVKTIGDDYKKFGYAVEVVHSSVYIEELTREAFRVRSHCATQADAKRNAATLTLEGVASRIACPMFIVTGKLDRVVPWRDAERLAREVKGPCDLLVIEDGGHVANNRGYRWRPQSADWMAERLGTS